MSTHTPPNHSLQTHSKRKSTCLQRHTLEMIEHPHPTANHSPPTPHFKRKTCLQRDAVEVPRAHEILHRLPLHSTPFAEAVEGGEGFCGLVCCGVYGLLKGGVQAGGIYGCLNKREGGRQAGRLDKKINPSPPSPSCLPVRTYLPRRPCRAAVQRQERTVGWRAVGPARATGGTQRRAAGPGCLRQRTPV